MKIKSKVVYQLLVGISFLMLFSGWRLGFSDDAEVIARDIITTAKVESGDFSIKIEGYGSLQSLNKRLITATSSAVVDEIKLKAGAVVDVDTVILTLINPKLEGELRQALAKLQNTKTQKRQTVLKQQRELLNNESYLSDLESQVEIAMLQVEAERTLAHSGIISGISAKKNVLKAKQLKNRVTLEKNKLAKLTAMQKESLIIQDDFIAQAQEEFNITKQMVEQLSVKAGMKGVIKLLSLNLGQSVVAGSELALIGSLSPLIAEIKVPQLQAHMVNRGMEAEISTVNGQIRGEVVRVDPVVNNGAVQVDIEINSTLNNGVKPMQLVDATIFAQVQQGVDFIKTPIGAKANSTAFLFKLSEDNKANRIEVKFGKVSGQFIQVLSGLKPGDEIISSKLTLSDEIKQIKFSS